MVIYREKNGFVDNGKPIGANHRCPKCSSGDYIETISREKCNACGHSVDYWAGAAEAGDDNDR